MEVPNVAIDATAGWKEAPGCWQQDMSKCSNATDPMEDVHTISILSRSDGSGDTGDWGSLAHRKSRGKMVKNAKNSPFMALLFGKQALSCFFQFTSHMTKWASAKFQASKPEIAPLRCDPWAQVGRPKRSATALLGTPHPPLLHCSRNK